MTQAQPLTPAEGNRQLYKARLRRWIGIFSAYFTAQTLTQLLSIAAGLLLIRHLPVRELALYTLAFSVVTFFTFLTDLGSTTSLLYFHQRAVAGGPPFAPYFAAVQSLRRGAFLLGALAVAVAFPVVARAKGYGWGAVALVTAGILVHVWFQIQTSIRLLALRLLGRYTPSYRAEVSANALRLLLACGMVLTKQLTAWLGVAVTAAGSGLSSWLAKPEAEAEPAPQEELGPYRRQVLRYLLPTLPSALYFAVQAPLVIWLAATFGSTRTIAEVGALARLGLVVGLFSGLTSVVFLPRLAAIADDGLYRRRALQFGFLLALIVASIWASAALAPRLFLLLLGPNYSGLQRELLFTVAGSGVALLGSYVGGVNFARGWIRFQGVTLAGEVACTVVLLRLLPLSTSAEVLRYTLINATAALGFQCIVLALGFRRPEWVRWA